MNDETEVRGGKRRPTDRHRLMQWLDGVLVRRPVQLVLSGVLIGLTALLVGPSLGTTESLLNSLKVGEPAKETIKATRDFKLPPLPEEQERRRTEAASKVLPVFDHHDDRGADLLWRINRAFEAVTATEAKARARGARSAVDGSAAARDPAGRARPSPEALRQRFAAALEVEVSPETFEPLFKTGKTGFSADVRAVVVMLVGGVMDQLVISHRNVLKPFAGGPVMIRRLVDGRPSGKREKLASLARVKDLTEIRGYVRHQANVHGVKLTAQVRRAVVQLVDALVVANVNLTFNRQVTEEQKLAARNKIRGEDRLYAKGEVIVPDGMKVTAEHRRAVDRMESAYRGVSRVQVTLIGIALLVTILLGVIYRFAGSHFRGLELRPRDLVTMGVLAVGLLGLMRGALALAPPVHGQLSVVPYLLPIAAGPMLVRLLISAESAALFAVTLASLCGLMFERSGSLGLMVYYLVGGLVGAAGMAKVQSRSTVLRAGLLAGSVGALTALCLALIGGQLEVGTLMYLLLAAFGAGLCASFVTLALLPALEWLFAYTTDVSLLELANLNHPLLRDLMIRAPGTYHHSMVVGNLSEAACEVIGANPLSAHVAANFHDVGKMKNAPYFAENFKGGDNPHNRLKPSMSGLIIRNHLKHSLEMLREQGLPEPIIEIATQHHGTTLIEFFYHKAKREAEEGDEVREEDYRYPGPKPQTREAGVLMLADGVEAAARSLSEPTEDRLRSVVQRVINAKFADGQLDQTDLTLRDLHLIAKAFLQVLRGIYHQRPTYPWQREKDKDQARDSTRKDTGKGSRRGDQTPRADTEPSEEPSPAKEAAEEGGKKAAREGGKKAVQDGGKKAAQDGGKKAAQEGGKKAAQEGGKGGRGGKGSSKGAGGATRQQAASKGKQANGKKKDSGADKQARSRKGDGPRTGGGDEHDAAKDKHGEARGADAEPEGGRAGQSAAEPASPDEVATESSTDIKRLGLN